MLSEAMNKKDQGPVVQSIVNLTSFFSGQNVNCSSKYNI